MEKHVATSLTIRGAIVTILAALGFIGVDEVEVFSKETETLIVAGAAAFGAALSIAGRVRAKAKLVWGKPSA